MIGMMLYVSLALMVLAVVSNRYWHRQLFLTRDAVSKIRLKVDDLQKEVASVAAAYATLAHDTADTERRANRAEQEAAAALLELEAKKQAGTDRYHIFDRLEPRPGRFWEAAVRHVPDAATDRSNPVVWTSLRRYILIADTERDARRRVTTRMPRSQGFDVVHVVPCRIANLSVSRVSELSTFRKPSSGGDDEGGGRRAAGTQRA